MTSFADGYTARKMPRSPVAAGRLPPPNFPLHLAGCRPQVSGALGIVKPKIIAQPKMSMARSAA